MGKKNETREKNDKKSRDGGQSGIFGLFVVEPPPELHKAVWVPAAAHCCRRRPTPLEGQSSNTALPTTEEKEQQTNRKKSRKRVEKNKSHRLFARSDFSLHLSWMVTSDEQLVQGGGASKTAEV